MTLNLSKVHASKFGIGFLAFVALLSTGAIGCEESIDASDEVTDELSLERAQRRHLPKSVYARRLEENPGATCVEQAACAACRGSWGRHGISPFESCNCRTNDFGKPCRGIGDCEGQCLADEPERVVVEPGSPALGYFVGRCSEFMVSFGCHNVLRANAADVALVPLDELPPMLCMD